MQQQRPNIFSNLANNEDRITALLCNFLHFKPFRDGFLDLLGLGDYKTELTGHDFEIQYRTDEYGIPDMRLSNGNLECLFEVKVYSYRKLTGNQPDGYIDYLQQSDATDKRLFLLAPRYYHYRVEFAEKIYLGKGVYVNAFIDWEQIISKIEELELEQLSPFFSEFLSFLKDWFKPIDYKALKIETMYNKDFPSSLKVTTDIIRKVYESLDSADLNKGSFLSDILSEYGFYINQGTDAEFFFGIWFGFWEESGYPLVLCTSKKNMMDSFKVACEKEKLIVLDEIYWDWKCAVLPQNFINKDDTTIAKTTELLKRIADSLSAPENI